MGRGRRRHYRDERRDLSTRGRRISPVVPA